MKASLRWAALAALFVHGARAAAGPTGGTGRTVAAAVEAVKAMPARGPRDGVGNVLRVMAESVRYDPDHPQPRGPHEWSAERSLAAGSVNGCVESAKVFFRLFTAAYPSAKALYLDSFNADCPSGGHAVVEVADADGSVFIVDASSFERLDPGVREEDLARPVDIRPSLKGVVIQVPGKSDIFVAKRRGEYVAALYPYGQVFVEGKLEKTAVFPTLAGLNRHLAAAAERPGASFDELRRLGLILDYADAGHASFLYGNWCGAGQARHVIYGCYSSLPDKDQAEAIEPAARKQFRSDGKVLTCRRPAPPGP